MQDRPFKKRGKSGLPPESPIQETRLWQMVIVQALMDALSRTEDKQAPHRKREAIAWIKSYSEDFVTVCLCAGLDPASIREKSLRAIAKGTRLRTEMGKAPDYHKRKLYRMRYKQIRNENTIRMAATAIIAMVVNTGKTQELYGTQ